MDREELDDLLCAIADRPGVPRTVAWNRVMAEFDRLKLDNATLRIAAATAQGVLDSAQ